MRMWDGTVMNRQTALTSASTRRELWRRASRMSSARLRREISVKEVQLADINGVRYGYSPHMRAVDLWYLRMYRTALRRKLGLPVRDQSKCDHKFTIVTSLPVRAAGAITGWYPYRQCSRCKKVTPEECFKTAV